METNGPLGTLWVGLGLSAFYIALIWINTLLGLFTTPLFIVPATWLLDKLGKKPIGAGMQAPPVPPPAYPVIGTTTTTARH